MIRAILMGLRRIRSAITEPRVIVLSPATGRAAVYDPSSDLVRLDDGTIAKMSDIVYQLGLTPQDVGNDNSQPVGHRLGDQSE